MTKNIKLLTILLTSMLMGCESLDVNPTGHLDEEDINNEGGIEAFMAALYGHLPMDDFNVTDNADRGGYFSWSSIKWPMTSTGESVCSDNTGMYTITQGYWQPGYEIIRNANKQIDKFESEEKPTAQTEAWLGEIKFIRAYVYFQLVKRYGGVPILTKAQDLDEDLDIARNSHEECYDFILSDLDYAIEHMNPTSDKGRANKYVAAAFKSRVALFAGSIARYGGKYEHTVNDVMLCGIPAERANDYFQQAYAAAKLVEEGGYELYNGDGDKAVNFQNVFVKADDSKESVFIRQHNFNNYVHSFDAIYSPERMTSTYGNRYNITLDWVELFDGLPIDPATGKIKTTDDQGNYIVYDNATSIYDNAEPRLKGSIIMPGEVFKGVELDIRRGIIKEEVDPATPIKKFVADDYITTTPYNDNSTYASMIKQTTEVLKSQKPYVTSAGTQLLMNGLDGPGNGGSVGTLTGFHGKKWLNPDLTPSGTMLHSSFQSWIDIRYAEVLLNRAEAALELAQNGVENYDGKTMRTDAFECINKIRERAGATLLTGEAELSTEPAYKHGEGIGGFVAAPNRGLQIVRVERYKELAFEHKIYWDLRRWFTFDQQIYNYRRRMLNPFLFAKGATVKENSIPQGKYIFDARICERADNALTFETKFYYEQIPDAQRKSNPLLEQNAQY